MNLIQIFDMSHAKVNVDEQEIDQSKSVFVIFAHKWKRQITNIKVNLA